MDLLLAEITIGSILTGIIAFMFWKIRQFDAKDYVTRDEAKEMIEDKTDPFVSHLTKVDSKIDNLTSSVQSIGVAVARIDERTKRES